MDTLTLKLPPQLHRDIERASKRAGINKSEYLRRAAAAHLRLEEPRPKTFVSALEKMGDLVGIHKNGPRDLATNPKYMEGFGED